MMRHEDRGVISVYLALMLAVMIPLTLTMIGAARVSAIRLTLECAMDLASDSVLSEYNRELLAQYDLLFIDMSYGEGGGSAELLRDHLADYIGYNLHPERDLLLPGYRDYLGLSLDSVDVTGVSRATDEGGAVFRYMANSYMLEKYGIAYIQDAQDMIATSESEGIYESDIDTDCGDAQGRVDDIEYPRPDPVYDEEGNEIDTGWEEPPKNDPAGNINHLRSHGILSLVCKDSISMQGIASSQYASHRSLVVGDGMCEDWEARNSVVEQLLFNEYILEKCGNYVEPKDGSLLRYETEYVVMGRENDADNLKAIANRLLLLRGGANTVHFFRDSALKSEAKAMAAGLSFVTLLPEAEPAYEMLIDAAWIYAESLYDVRLLFAGDRVPLIKSHDDWNLSLGRALSLAIDQLRDVEESNGERHGLRYQEYLRLLLYTTPLDERTARCMDIVEMDIRKVSGYENFRLDDCAAAATVQYLFRSSYGYTCLATRRFRYM